MKKGQGASKRKTALEALYGNAGAGEAGKHVALLHEYDFAVHTLELLEHVIATDTAKNKQAVKDNAEKIRQRIPELKELVFLSWEKVRRQPETLIKLAAVAERNRDDKGAVYHQEFAVLAMYEAGEKSHQRLLQFAEQVNPKISAADFSEIVKRYSLVLTKAKPGRKRA
jgi:hypothetical protein